MTPLPDSGSCSDAKNCSVFLAEQHQQFLKHAQNNLIFLSEATDLFLLTLKKGEVSLRQTPGVEKFSSVLAKFSVVEKMVSRVT